MQTDEIAVWSIMLGGLLTLAAAALAEALFNRSINAWRNFLFVVVTGTSCVVMTGLPEVFFPDLPDRTLMLFKAGLGPLSAAMALNFLGIWLGGIQEDRLVHRITTWGAGAVFLAALALAVLVAQSSGEEFDLLLLASAAITMVAVVLGLFVSTRAATLGDPLARWMVLACVCMTGMAAGLYWRGLNVGSFGLGTWILTVACTLAYFLITTTLISMRIRQSRQLARLARLEIGADRATGLPTGSVLLSKVEHAFWRTARMNGECTVVCLYLNNLYELGEAAGHGVANQILAAMSARIRRTAGFRCVVGLYHPRCFVVVISAYKRRHFVNSTITRLRSLVAQPLPVVGLNEKRLNFLPRLGVGVVTLNPDNANPMEVINDAERLALALVGAPQTLSQDHIDTAW